MMLLAQGFPKQTCTLLAVPCNRFPNDAQSLYPFPELISSGRLEIHILTDPSLDEFQNVLESTGPNIVYLQGEHVPNEEELGGLVWKGVDLSNVDELVDVFGSTLPTTVYLEFSNGQKLAEALHSKGIPYVIYWKSSFSIYAACHFRQALLSVIQSSLSHTWDAFQLAYSSFRLHCEKNNSTISANGQTGSKYPRPYLLGECPKIEISPPFKEPGDEEVSETNPSIKIHDEEANLRFLVCGEPCTMNDCLLGPLEDGLNALLCIEIRGSKLHNRVSAPPPPLQAGTYSRGVVTMRCDLLTSSSTHISLLVSGSAQTCFDDQLLETYIKNELIENNQLVHALPSSETHKVCLPEPRRSASVACGATVFEVDMKVPTWASQVLRQLAPELSYRSLVSLGIACIQGCPVASFEKEDAKRLLYFSVTQEKANCQENIPPFSPPLWFKPPTPCRTVLDKSCDTHDLGSIVSRVVKSKKFSRTPAIDQEDKDLPTSQPPNRKMKIAAMRPVPRMRQQKLLPFSGSHEVNNGLDVNLTKTVFPVAPTVKHNLMPCGPTHRKNQSNSLNSQQIISLNPLPLKKHGCGRPPIPVCSEEEFLRDVMQFLILRGHTRLIPQGGLAEFPEAILNAKRLDLYNLYREVVSRGGFHVGNGINWKGQVFSKMRNHTLTNRMTGVGNTLKRHYETYLLEYELAHDDVDGECCLLCHSSAAGDWVNCSVCDEWAHFGCDRRQGLGAFKDYAKTDGLEYICPHCSVTNLRKKTHKASNGLPVSNIRNT